ncbi:MAG: exo-alpha-sialidase [Gemmatimonadetes bacterium]|nr:exo-alpha-sialidase [Gemmatimonadota bacterium]
MRAIDRRAGVRLLIGAMVAFCGCGRDTVEPEGGRYAPGDAAILSVGHPGKDEDPSVLRARDGSMYVAWFSDRTASGDIYIARVERGTAWSAPVRVTTDPGGDFNPHLIQDAAGTFHLAWFRWTAPFRGHIWYNHSADGVTWNPAQEVQVTAGADVDDWVPTLVKGADGSLLIIFVSAKRSTAGQVSDLYFSRRADGQQAWSAPAPIPGLNSPTEHDHLPRAVRAGTEIALAWVRHDTSQALPWLNSKSDVFYATSSDGLVWSAPRQVTHEAGRIVNLFPGLYVQENGVLILHWLSTRAGDPRLFELEAARIDDYPAGLSQVGQVGEGYSHRIESTGSPRVYLGAWVRGPDGAQEIVYRFFTK